MYVKISFQKVVKHLENKQQGKQKTHALKRRTLMQPTSEISKIAQFLHNPTTEYCG